jgi:uncharacterized protein
MFSRSLVTLLGAALVGCLLAACGEKPSAATSPKTVNDFFPVKIGARTVRMQIAALPPEVERGLMFRPSLGRDEGMLFIFSRGQQMSFWMRNTTIPLDIGYIDAQGVLREIYPMYPLDEKSVVSRGRDLKFALEVNQGWFKENGVKPGDKLDLDAVRAALRARELRLEAFGLR